MDGGRMVSSGPGDVCECEYPPSCTAEFMKWDTSKIPDYTDEPGGPCVPTTVSSATLRIAEQPTPEPTP